VCLHPVSCEPNVSHVSGLSTSQFVCLHPVSCEPNVTDVSELSIS
jgi:hypothetical protein